LYAIFIVDPINAFVTNNELGVLLLLRNFEYTLLIVVSILGLANFGFCPKIILFTFIKVELMGEIEVLVRKIFLLLLLLYEVDILLEENNLMLVEELNSFAE
jgi:hypothetical protein